MNAESEVSIYELLILHRLVRNCYGSHIEPLQCVVPVYGKQEGFENMGA